MSGQLPTTPTPRSANIGSEQNTLISITTSGRVQARQIDGQRFSITLAYPPMTRAEFAPIKAFLMKQRSRLETFTVIPPETEADAQGTVAGLPTGTGSAGDTSITLGGTGTGSLKAGDYIKFDHDKVYMVVEDKSDISSGSITIEPPLREAISSASITFDNVPFTVRLRNDVQEFSIGTTNLYQYELDVIESL